MGHLDRQGESVPTEGEDTLRPQDETHLAPQRVRAFEDLPALLSSAEFAALFPFGRTWFWEHEKAGCFRAFEVTFAGKRFYNGRLVARALGYGDTAAGDTATAPGTRRFFGRARHQDQPTRPADAGPREVRRER